MIYSCTVFLNEVQLLTLKLNEEVRGGVDKFIIVESGITFSGRIKERLLTNAYFPPQVQVVEIGEEMAQVPANTNTAITPFQREAIQRNAALKDIVLADDDVVIASDIDEIIVAEEIPTIVEAARQHGCVHLDMDLFHYKVNLWVNQAWYAPFAVTGAYLRGKTLNQVRNTRTKRLATNGKHFCHLMSPEAIANKLCSFSHINFATPEFADPVVIEQKIKRREDLFSKNSPKKIIPVMLDSGYPKTLLAQMDMWQPWIEQGKVSLAAAKQYMPLMPDLSDEEFAAQYGDFYRTIDNLEITFPWRKL